MLKYNKKGVIPISGKTKLEAFIAVPKALFSEEYSNISATAKLLYILLLDRNSLSQKNGWVDQNGNTFFYYTVQSVCEVLYCAKNTAMRLLKELESGGLVCRKKQGLGKPDKIYLLHSIKSGAKIEPDNRKNCASRGAKFEPTAAQNLSPNNNEYNNTYISNHYHIIRRNDTEGRMEVIKEIIDYEFLSSQGYGKQLDDIVMIMCDVICSDSPTVRVGGSNLPRDRVEGRLMSLERTHIEYVLEVLSQGTKEIHNIRSYVLTLLYNAPTTMDSYYDAQLRATMAKG